MTILSRISSLSFGGVNASPYITTDLPPYYMTHETEIT